jgi:hypothetical protein
VYTRNPREAKELIPVDIASAEREGTCRISLTVCPARRVVGRYPDAEILRREAICHKDR